MNTLDNNKLIAEFMGFDILSNGYFNYEGEITRSLPEFNSDWNWLMEVVEKIESLSKNNTVILDWSRNNWTIFDILITASKIEAVYDACVDFIKWNNNQKS
jgi:hypothetical protein